MKNKYRLISVHEENLSETEILCIFLNINMQDNSDKESVIGLLNKTSKIYLFFNSVNDMNMYRFDTSNRTMQRAYYTEDMFDEYYDNGSDKLLSDILEYIKS